MSFPNRFHRRAVWLPGSIVAVVLALVLAMTVSRGAIGAAHPVHGKPHVAVPVRLQQDLPESLDPLRVDALQGNVDASVGLAQLLLDRFDRTGEQDNLYEAFQWIARDWDQVEFLRSDVIQRAVVDHCDGPVLRWHWLCVAGE